VKRTILLPLTAGVLVTAVACGTAASPSTLDTQGTVDAAVAGTATARAGVQETIDAAVAATVGSIPTPTLAPEYVEMSEEDLSRSIDEAVTEASVTAEEAEDATAEAAADDTITQEEVEEVAACVADAEDAIALANDLIDAYYALYGDLALETLDLLLAVEDDLFTLAGEVAAVGTILLEVESALDQGRDLDEDTIARLEAAVQAAAGDAVDLARQSQDWVRALQDEIQARVANALNVEPSEVAANRVAALGSAFGYVDAVRDGLADNVISQDELAHIAQLGANASAGLSARGGPQLGQLSDSVNQLTGMLAGGQVPLARANLGALESALGARP
jgi:hypothetical protein